ncbi:hypothetical protein V6Z12_A12G315700 [Gossypium hirsutum]
MLILTIFPFFSPALPSPSPTFSDQPTKCNDRPLSSSNLILEEAIALELSAASLHVDDNAPPPLPFLPSVELMLQIKERE